MKFLSNTFAVVFVVSLLAALVFGVFWSFQFVANIFAGLDKQLGITLGIVSITLLLCAFVIAGSIRWLGKAVKYRRLLKVKMAAYGQLVNIWRTFLKQPRVETDENASQLLYELESHLTLCASSTLILIN